LNLLDSLDAIRGSFSDTLGHHGRPVLIAWYDRPQSGLMADSHQTTIASPEKIQIGSVLEILVFANGKRRLIGRIASKYAPWASGG